MAANRAARPRRWDTLGRLLNRSALARRLESAHAPLAELVDAPDSSPGGFGRESSSLSGGTSSVIARTLGGGCVLVGRRKVGWMWSRMTASSAWLGLGECGRGGLECVGAEVLGQVACFEGG